MNIGIIVYSQTGNTHTVAKRLQEKLVAAGHSVKIEQITIEGKTPAQPGKFTLIDVPVVDNYEAIILGGPVQAFSLNPVMKSYLEQLPSLTGKKVACFATKHLPLMVTGGKQAVASIKKACELKGAAVVGSAIVIWSGAKREQSINQSVENLAKLF